MTTFRIKPHSVVDGRAAVEIIGDDGSLRAVLFATNDNRLRVVSKYLDTVDVQREYPPAVAINLKPRNGE